MTRLLHVIASPRGAEARSTRLTDEVVAGFIEAGGEATVDRWDLWAELPPLFGPRHARAKMATIAGDGLDADAAAAWDEVVRTATRFAQADLYVLGVPMWNGSIPWPLKLLIDTVNQPGLAFRFDPDRGYHGLLDGQAVTAYTSRTWAPGVSPAFGTDFQSTYFDSWLESTGLRRAGTVRLQPSNPSSPGFADRAAEAATRARSLGRSLATRAPAPDGRPPSRS